MESSRTVSPLVALLGLGVACDSQGGDPVPTPLPTENVAPRRGFRGGLMPIRRIEKPAAAAGDSASAEPSASASAAPLASPTPLAGVPGIYVVSRPSKPVDDATLALESVDGLSAELLWKTVEPTEGKLDWALLDAQLKLAVAHSKRISLSIVAGGATPDWVFGAGAKKLEFDVARADGKGTSATQKIAIAAPWDPVFLAKWKKLVFALSAHVREVPGAYDKLVLVKITGIGELTGEIRLPAGHHGKANPLDPDLKNWKEQGYRPSKVVDAYREIAADFATAFPDKALGLAVMESGGFPLIDEAGEIKKPPYNSANDAVTHELIVASTIAYRDRLIVQANDLRATLPEALVAQAGKVGVPIGFQTNGWLFAKNQHGVGCGSDDLETAKECTEEDFAKVLERGIALGARALEVYPYDAVTFPKAMTAAHAKLSAVKAPR